MKSEIWPHQLSLRISRTGFSLANVHAWVKNVAPPLCMFMPGSNTDPKVNRANQNSFRSFAKLLRERQIVAISRWQGPHRVPGSGIIVFPVEATDGLLAAAIFHSTAIPEFTPERRQQPMPSLYTDDYLQAQPSTMTLGTQSWSTNQVPYSVSSTSNITYNNGSIWSGEVFSSPSYAIPRSHYLHTSPTPLDIELAQPNSNSSPLSTSDLFDFDWPKRQTQYSDAHEQFNSNIYGSRP